MALSDVSRRAARSDLRARLAQYTQVDLNDGELNKWLDLGQFDVFLRLSQISNIWYGTRKSISLTVTPGTTGAVTAHTLTGTYAPDKIHKLTKLILASGELVPFVEDDVINSLPYSSTYDYSYAVNWYGEDLYVFAGRSATALASNAASLYFIRKPDEMQADTSVWQATLTSVIAGNYLDIEYGGLIHRFTCCANAKTIDSGDNADQGTWFAVGASDAFTTINLDAAIANTFQNAIDATYIGNVMLISGASRVSGSATFASITESVSSYVDVPTEYVDLVIMSAMSKAMTKLNQLQAKQGIDQSIAEAFNEIRGSYSSDIQAKQVENAPGIQTPRMR
jgi:hypothetical protein